MKNKLIQKNSNGNYSLTVYGKTICAQMPSIFFVYKNKKYFEAHDLGNIPQKYIQRIGALEECKLVEGYVKVLEKWTQVHEEAKKYIVINDTIKQKISKIAEIEASLTADDPEKRAKIDKDLLAVVKPMLAVIKSDKDNAKLIDHVLKKDSEGAGQARPGFVPSVESKQLFANYKSTGELEGGMAIADDMSDVPGLVAEGNLDFNKFKKRTDLWDKGIDVALAEVEKVKKKYS